MILLFLFSFISSSLSSLTYCGQPLGVNSSTAQNTTSTGSWNKYIVCLLFTNGSISLCFKKISVYLCNYLYLLLLLYNVMSIFNFLWICWISVHFQKRLRLKWSRGTIKGFFHSYLNKTFMSHAVSRPGSLQNKKKENKWITTCWQLAPLKRVETQITYTCTVPTFNNIHYTKSLTACNIVILLLSSILKRLIQYYQPQHSSNYRVCWGKYSILFSVLLLHLAKRFKKSDQAKSLQSIPPWHVIQQVVCFYWMKIQKITDKYVDHFMWSGPLITSLSDPAFSICQSVQSSFHQGKSLCRVTVPHYTIYLIYCVHSLLMPTLAFSGTPGDSCSAMKLPAPFAPFCQGPLL